MRAPRNLLVLLTLTIVAACGGGGGGGDSNPRSAPLALATGPAACVNGQAANFACSGIRLRKRIPLSVLGGGGGNDIWGWYDATTGKEYALVGMTNGTAFVDVSNPDNPIRLGVLPTAAGTSAWRDIKVYRNYAYVVADGAGGNGMQVFDLTRLRGVTAPQTFSADFLYTDFGDAHNIAIDETSGFAYVVGSDTCNGGLHMIDLSSPANPVFAGCHQPSYTHDTQCVVYHGPDTAHVGREICFNSNEDHIAIVDVTNKTAPVTLSTLMYPQTGYVHQGWLSEDQSHFYVGDELDELLFDVPTRTIVLDVTDLDAPVYASTYESNNASTDHNLYVRGNRIYEADYTTGLRVLQIADAAEDKLSEIAFFDTFPSSDAAGFDGVWSVYPYLPSGTLIASDMTNGLFVLTMDIPTAFATVAETAFERDTIDVNGAVAGSPVSTRWVQTSGTPATIAAPTAESTKVTLPSLTASEWLSFDLVVDDGRASRAVDTAYVQVNAYPPISPAPVRDPVLQQCIATSAAGAEDIGSVYTLTCDGVSDVSGLDQFPVLSSLVLTGNSVANLSTLNRVASLQSLDLSGVSSLPCAALENLASSLDAAVSFIQPTTCRISVISDLGGSAFDSALDLPRRRLYVSVPSRREIVAADLDSGLIVDRIAVPGEPWGIDLSLDGTRLFVAVRYSDSVREIDLGTGAQRSIPLNGVAGDSRTHDVVEAQPDRLFVSADPGSSGFAWIVQVMLAQGDAVSQVASQSIIRAAPKLAASSDGQFLYVGEGFYPNSLYRLNLTDPLAPIVLENASGSVSGTQQLALDASGTRIALGSGQVLRTGSFIEEGSIPSGSPAISESGDRFAVNSAPGIVEYYDAQTLDLASTQAIECDLPGLADRVHSFDGDSALAVIADSALCVTADIARNNPPDPYPELHFTDIGLERCVRATAQARGWTAATEIQTLDCSTSTRTIQSLDGIDKLTKLTQIDISGSGVLDLEPLSSLPNLTTIVAANTQIADLRPIQGMAALSSLDLTGSPNASCGDLDTLAVGGITVTADFCVDFRETQLAGLGFDVELDEAANRAFVSVPVLKQILEVDLTSFTVVRTFVTSGQPNGIALSQDRSTLYVALGDLRSIAYIDLATGAETVVDVSAELGDEPAHDIAEVAPDQILVSGSGGGFSYIVEVRRDLGNAAQRVASNQIIRAEPEFAVAPDRSAVFVREGYTPPSVYKLDATQPALPLVAEDVHGSLEDTRHIQISPDGSLLILRGGQLVETSAVKVVGQLPMGISTFTTDGSAVLVEENGFDGVGVYDLATQRKVGQRHWGCPIVQSKRLVARSDGRPLILGDDLLCSIETVPR